jgi:hypothetical protein
VPVVGSTGFHRKSEIVLCELRRQDRRQRDVGEDLEEDESDYLAKRKEMTSKVVEDLTTLIQFETEIMLVGVRRPTAPQFYLELRGGVREGGEGGRNASAEAMGRDRVSRAKDVERL